MRTYPRVLTCKSLYISAVVLRVLVKLHRSVVLFWEHKPWRCRSYIRCDTCGRALNLVMPVSI